ncbi:MAG TPA: cytochrome c oxidase subunit 3 [Chloroflexia bacterium]
MTGIEHLNAGNAEVEAPHLDRFERLEPNQLAVALFIVSEVVFFAMLIIAYIFYRDSPAVAGGPTAKRSLDIALTTLFSICLFASSGTIWFADRSLARGNEKGVRLWLGATIVLGAIFIGGQGYEYSKLLSEDITLNTNLFGTTFYTLTGFHGLHVTAGLIALIILFVLALTGQFRNVTHNSAMAAISLYWHFVDVVWVVVFSVVYIWALF